MIQKMLGNSRYLIVIAVFGSYLTSAIVIIYNSLLLVRICIDFFIHPNISSAFGRQLVLECIEVLDSFLLGTAFFIVALGLYELFVKRPTSAPGWLHVRDLDDLKARLLGVIIVVMSIFFLEQVINWDGKRDLLGIGVAEALMIGAITLTIRIHQRVHDEKSANTENQEPIF